MIYTVIKTDILPDFDIDHPIWTLANKAKIGNYHVESSSHRPPVTFQMLHNGQMIMIAFRAEDQYVRSLVTEPNGPVCTDSCVEWFVQPKTISQGYINLEVNAGGTPLASHIRNWRRTPEGFADFDLLTPDQLKQIKIVGNLPPVTDPEYIAPLTWWSIWQIPVSFFESVFGELGNLSGQLWKGNFFKCADATSHPHWGSYFPIGEALNFHDPDYFGSIRFE